MVVSQNFRVIIGSVPIIVEVDRGLGSVIQLIRKFPTGVGESEVFLRIKIQSADKNLIRLSKNHNQLLIEGPDINNLAEPFNTIGIFQGILRFAGLHAIQQDFVLLHASSASMLRGETLCFADDGKSLAKTLSSVEVALASNEYIGDEFCFLNTKTNRISGYSWVPIHLRSRVRYHLETKHKMKLPPTCYRPSAAGYFFNPSLLFSIRKSAKLNAFIFVKFSRGGGRIQRLNYSESYRALSNTVAAHIIKLLNPEYDRMQFISGSVSSKTVTYDDNLVFRTVKKLRAGRILEKLARSVPCFSFRIQYPCEIVEALTSLKLQ